MARAAIAGTSASWTRVAIRSALSKGDCVTREKPPLATTGEGHDNTISKPGHARPRGRAVAGRRTRGGLACVLAVAFAPGGFAQESHHIALFPAAAGERQGFVRVINHDDETGSVAILGFDDSGRRVGPVTLPLAAGQVVHFNSDDFENGNATKGLAPGVGAPALGDWRLALSSTLDIEALAFLRTRADRFLTSARDVAPAADGVHRIAIFNPGSNTKQVSQLRVVNPSDDAAVVVVCGVDDDGTQGQAVTMTVPAGAARVYTAKKLEDGHPELQGALGRGNGKWRLTATSTAPVRVMSLLLSTDSGRLSNLSSVAPPPTVAAGTRTHQVPLFPAKDDAHGRQGFVRLVNHSAAEVAVSVTAFDRAGAARGPVKLTVASGRAKHFNSKDLEDGAPDKGLVGGIGAGDGDWRLELSTEGDIEVLAYIRMAGFLTSMHDVAPTAAGSHRVAIFNPGENTRQVSMLRLVNPGQSDAQATVRGVDDGGAASGEAVLTIPARGARTVSAAALEKGEGPVDGALGIGRGKWRLTVASADSIAVMSLLESPTRHLTNLSTAADRASGTAAETSADMFAASVSEPIVQQRCVNCHVAGGLSGGTRLVFVRDTDEDHMATNLAAFESLLERTPSGRNLVLDKVRGLRGHGGGLQLQEDSEDYANLERFLALLESEINPGGDTGEPPPLALDGVGHPMLVSPHSRPIAMNGSFVYVANTPADTVDVIDAGTRAVVERIDVGVDPVSVVPRPDGREVWVANHVSDTLSVIDTDPSSRSFHQVIATVQDIHPQTLATRFDEPVGIAFATDRKAYVALSTANRVAIVDVAARAVTGHLPIRAQDPRAMVVRGNRLYVAAFESNNQSQLSGCFADDIDGDTCTFDAVQHVFTTNNVLSEGYDADIVKNPNIPDRDIFVFDTETDREVDVVNTVGTLLYGIAVDSEGNVFVAQTDARNVENGRAGTLKHGLAEMENRAFLNQITKVSCRGGCRQPTFFDLEPLPPEHPGPGAALATPFAVRVSADDATLVATAAGSDKLFTVDAESGEVLGRVAVGAAPRGIALTMDANGAPQEAWVLNAVDNTVSLVDLRAVDNPAVLRTIALVDPTDRVVKQGRIAFNDADASSTGTFSCESCHPDGHTDQLIWVLQTPNCGSGGGDSERARQLEAGCTQVPPRLTMPVRGLRDTQPYHWDGIPGDPFGGNNTASVTQPVDPNCDLRKPESCTRHLVDGSLATTMCDVTNCPTNDEGKDGLLDADVRDALATFILNVPYPPAPTRPFDNVLTPAARDGFFEFNFLNDSSGRTTGAQTCGVCHRPPFLVSTNTPGTGMEAPTWRGAYDRWMITPQARTNIIDLMRLVNMDDSFPERNVWILGGATPDIWEMVVQGGTGFSGSFARQVTLNADTAEQALTARVLDALETSATEDAIVLQAEGLRWAQGTAKDLALEFEDGYYIERDGDADYSRADLVAAAAGDLFLTITARSGPNIGHGFPQPGLWPVGEIQTQTRNMDMPSLSATATLRVNGRHVREGASVFVDGRRVDGHVRCESGVLPQCDGETVLVELASAPDPGGVHFLAVQNPGGMFSNDLLFFNEQAVPPRTGNLVHSGGTFPSRGWWDNSLGRLWRGERRNHWNTVEEVYDSGLGRVVRTANFRLLPGGGLDVDVLTARQQRWNAQISHAVMVVGGREYTVCYTARAEAPRHITMYMDSNLDRWANISGGQHRADLTTTWQTFQETFTVQETDMTARLAFDLAQSPLNVQLDNVGVYEGTECGAP